VYREGTFRPTAAHRRRTIRVRTPAFDVSGWLDLTSIRAGDAFDIEVRVSFAGRRGLLYARTRFESPALVPLAEFANGNNNLSGTDIIFVIRQSASADGFATPISVAYQFIVESV
jgi:hypothetical protein